MRSAEPFVEPERERLGRRLTQSSPTPATADAGSQSTVPWRSHVEATSEVARLARWRAPLVWKQRARIALQVFQHWQNWRRYHRLQFLLSTLFRKYESASRSRIGHPYHCDQAQTRTDEPHAWDDWWHYAGAATYLVLIGSGEVTRGVGMRLAAQPSENPLRCARDDILPATDPPPKSQQ